MTTSADLYKKLDDLDATQTDYSGIKQRQATNQNASNRALLMALAANEAGKDFAPIGQFAMQQASDYAKAPKLEGAVADAEGNVTEDPGYGRTRKYTALERQAGVLAGQESQARTSADNRAAQGERAASDRAMRMSLAQFAAANRPAPQQPLVQVQDAAGNITYVPRDQAAGLSPPKKPASMGKGGDPKANATEAIALLDQAGPLLDGATSSGVGNLRDKALGFVGHSTDAGDAAAALKALGGALTLKMPRMEGPQSDADRLLYTQMAGSLGDPSVPTSQKKTAIATIREIQERYAGTGGGGASGEWSGNTPPAAAPARAAGGWTATRRK